MAVVQVVPSPMYPALHAHVRLPGVLVHVAFAEQPPLEVRHSLMSEQVRSVVGEPDAVSW